MKNKMEMEMEKMKSWMVKLGLVVWIIGGLWSCHEDVVIKPDPCAGVHPASALFSTSIALLTNYGLDTSQFKADTFYGEQRVQFKVNDSKVDSCFWKIGFDPSIFKKKDFGLDFNEGIGSIEIKLIVKKLPNFSCFPKDDGADTVNKTITFLQKSEHPIYGQYYGSDNEFPDKFYTIAIYHKPQFPNGTSYIYNFPNGSNLDSALNTPDADIWLVNKRYFQTDGVDDQFKLEDPCQIHGYLSKDDQTITIKYNRSKLLVEEFPATHVYYFKGKRIK